MKTHWRQVVRKVYRNKKIDEFIRKIYPKTDPYLIGFHEFLSPMEKLFWGHIRNLGLPFYPEYPVKQYFIDFADPVMKIGIELDSKQWHTNTEDEDNKRQAEIEKDGWIIYRFSTCELFERDYEIEDKYNNIDYDADDTKFYKIDTFLKKIIKDRYHENKNQI